MKKTALTFAAGVFAGAILFGGTAALATYRDTTMNISYRDIKIVVDGAEFTPRDVNGTFVEPFVSNGTTYLPVRAVASALGKEVGWNGDTNTVYIGAQPQKENPTTTATPTAALSIADRITITDRAGGGYTITTTGDAIPGKLANGKDITAENIADIFAELEIVFPAGTSWGTTENGGDRYYYTSRNFGTNHGCNSWAYMTADLLFGKGAAYTTHNDLSLVKAGDVVHLRNNATNREHWFVVTGTGDQLGLPVILTCEGNLNSKVGWIERPTKATISDYPDTIIYSFYPK